MLLAAVHGLLRSSGAAADVLLRRPVRRRTPDRMLLEQQILPTYARRPDIERVLFVGCARYTRHYEDLFARQQYWTIDAAARRRRWAARRHIGDRLEHLVRYVADGYFDVIVCNGVLGWGLNRRGDAEAAFAACRAALRAGGELLLGWNDVWPHNRVRPSAIDALALFERAALPGLGVTELRVDAPHRHVFECYRKPCLAAEQGARIVGASGAGARAAHARHFERGLPVR